MEETLSASARLRDYGFLVGGSLLLAVDLNLFLAPSQIAPGGVSGTAIILNHYTGWPLGIMMLVLNIPLLALGYRHLGRFRFLTRTLLVVLLYNLGVDVLAPVFAGRPLTSDLLLNSLYGGLVGGVATGLVYRGGGTIGGTGIVSRILQKRSGVPASQVYLITDGGVILAAGLVFGWEKALYALIALFVWGLANDFVLEGPSVVRTAFVVTDRPAAVARALLSQLGLGVTSWPARGTYTGARRTVLFCTLSRPDVDALRAVVSAVDPEAFLVIGHGHQAKGGMTRLAEPGSGQARRRRAAGRAASRKGRRRVAG
jgi:uncharacterized membrane-anchored protein YitT (DUF2179 family)